MYRNYIKIALRSVTKQPFFSFLNVMGLAIGMAGAILIALYLYEELGYDRMFTQSELIYRVNIDNKTAGEVTKYASVSAPLADVLRTDFPYQQLVTRFREVDPILIKKEGAESNAKIDKVTAVDETFFEMFGLSLIIGNEEDALLKPFSLVLTRTMAEKYFGSSNDAMNQSMIIDDGESYVITGIIEDFPSNSFLKNYSMLISLSSYKDAKTEAWNTWYFPTFVKLNSTQNQQDLDVFLSGVVEGYLIPWAMTFIPGLTVESSRKSSEETGNYMRFSSIALTDIHLNSQDRSGDFNENGDIRNIYILAIVGLFLVVMAVVNFMNLSTAQSLKRAKEVGIRKTVGSNRFGLVRQFLVESELIASVSVILALILAVTMLPFFNQLGGTSLTIPFDSILFWLIVVLSTLILGLLAGIYPALVISRFAPIKALAGNGKVTSSGGLMRNVLVVFQFTISVCFMVGTLVVYQQLQYIKTKSLGYDKNRILVIDNVKSAGNNLNVFKQEVQTLARTENVSLSSFLPTPSDRNGTTFFKESSLGPSDAVIIGNWRIDHDYLETLGLELVAGRNFDPTNAADSSALLINETSLSMFDISIEEAIGMRVTRDFQREDKENMEYYTVIGVVKDFHFESMRNAINGLTFRLGADANKMMVKLKGGDYQKAIENIQTIWEKVSPGQPFEYYFMDESFDNTYRSELRLGSIFLLFTSLSIFIACIGLFGLAAFNTEKRTKEIGIRKVLGAGIGQIFVRLSVDFLKLVGIALVVALPLSWLLMNKWLQNFSYRIELGVGLLIICALLAAGIAILTVSYQSIKAAIVNPVESLKNE
ncbi:ABC transporter permease [Fulvivirga lutea]|uniref:ABC transporter permease n=2 Tax=Fulvivirga lutea TaxID=2810512 RepID=A0A974WIY7_9BACT|nr:ABC transporter permease [Fulvivirga lutea]